MADKEDETGSEPEASFTGPESEWDFDFARRLMGKYVMASFSYLKPDGVTVREHEQVHGIVIDATRDEGFTLALRGSRKGETVVLPPNPSAFVKLAPGNYRLSSTNERVVNPDYTSLWKVVDAENKTD